VQEQTELDHWLEKIQDILEAPSPNAMDFLDTIKLNLYSAEIFVFTPKGEIKTLPQNATALDFAYEIHSNIGDHCIGAKINHRLTPISHKLESGDQIEILTSNSQHPQSEWMQFVTTAKAKTKIEYALRKQRKSKTKTGEEWLYEQLKKANIEVTTQILDKFCSFYGYTKKEDLFLAFAEKQIELPDNPQKVLREKTDNIFVRNVKKIFKYHAKDTAETDMTTVAAIDRHKTYLLQEEDFQKNFIIPSCCHPIPGEEVFGFIRDDERLEIHKMSCAQGLLLKSRYGNRIVSCEWAGHKSFSVPASVEIKGIDRIGMLSDITKVITNDLSVNMRRLTFDTKDGFFEGTIEVSIHDVEDVSNLSSRLQKIKGVKSVLRVSD